MVLNRFGKSQGGHTAKPEFLVTWKVDVVADSHEDAALAVAKMAGVRGSLATVYTVEDTNNVVVEIDTEGSKACVLRDYRGAPPDYRVEVLLREIQEKLEIVKKLATQPFNVQLGGDAAIRLQPASLTDDRVIVSCKGLGHTVVKYTNTGVVLDVVAEGQRVSTWSEGFPRNVLSGRR